MADIKRSGSRRAPQPLSEVLRLVIPRPSKYTLVLECAENLNRAFDQVLSEALRLKQMGFFSGEVSSRFLKTCRLSVEELRAWAMAEVTEDVLDWAEHDWGHYGVQRFRFEEKFRDPEDVLKQAERLKKEREEQAAKRAMKRSRSPRRKKVKL
jgi:hypothetical protein